MNALFVDPGQFNRELSLQAAELTADGAGGHAETWQEVATVFAHVEPIAAKSIHGAGQTLETVTHRIMLRRRDDVLSGMRFVRQGRIFEILTAHDPDDSGRYLVCLTLEAGL